MVRKSIVFIDYALNIYKYQTVILVYIYCSCSTNLTVEGSPFQINRETAKEVVENTPKSAESQEVEPIGMCCIDNMTEIINK